MILTALHDNIIVKPLVDKHKTSSGIFLAKNTQPDTGRVMAVGPDVPTVKIGMKVLFKKWNYTEIPYEGVDKKGNLVNEKWFVLQMKDLLAIV